MRSRPLRVGINARLLASPDRRGFNRYTAELVRALAARDDVVPVLFSDQPLAAVHGLSAVETHVDPARPHAWWQHARLPRQLARHGIDLFHAPAHWGVPIWSRCPVVATIHDLADHELPGPHTGPVMARLRHVLEERLIVERAALLVAVSQWTASCIRLHLGVPVERIAVTVEGVAIAIRTPPRAAHSGVAGLHAPYFLYVGGTEPRKNVPVLVEALVVQPEAHRLPIALVGSGPWDAVQALAVQRGVANQLRTVGPVEDAALAALYDCATAVVLPSKLEGFGLPVVEAMHRGTPAVVTAAGALPEVVGEAGLVVPPDDPAALAAALTRIATDDALRATLALRARARAPSFTWDVAAEQTVAAYRKALA